MNNHEGKGGSYTRQPNGSLKLSQRTEHPDTVFAVTDKSDQPAEQPQSDAVEANGKGNK
ncbi:hypothetical protein ACXHXM_01985